MTSNVRQKVDGPPSNFYVGDYVSRHRKPHRTSPWASMLAADSSPDGHSIGNPRSAGDLQTQVCPPLIDDNLIQNVVRDCACIRLQVSVHARHERPNSPAAILTHHIW